MDSGPQVDAARCAGTSGQFYIRFIREKENAMELEFSEPFTWQVGQLQTAEIEVAVDFWRDEAILDYSLAYVALCPCRD
jgi:hypothetical protein